MGTKLSTNRLQNGSMTSPNNGVVAHQSTPASIKRPGAPVTTNPVASKAKKVRPANHIAKRPAAMQKPAPMQTQTDTSAPDMVPSGTPNDLAV